MALYLFYVPNARRIENLNIQLKNKKINFLVGSFFFFFLIDYLWDLHCHFFEDVNNIMEHEFIVKKK